MSNQELLFILPATFLVGLIFPKPLLNTNICSKIRTKRICFSYRESHPGPGCHGSPLVFPACQARKKSFQCSPSRDIRSSFVFFRGTKHIPSADTLRVTIHHSSFIILPSSFIFVPPFVSTKRLRPLFFVFCFLFFLFLRVPPFFGALRVTWRSSCHLVFFVLRITSAE